MPIAKPEFGPSLPELIGSQGSGRMRWVWLAVAVGAALALVAALLWILVPRGEETVIRINANPVFNTTIDSRVKRVAAKPGELLRLEVPLLDADDPEKRSGPEVLVYRDGGPAPAKSEPVGGPVSALALRMAPLLRETAKKVGPSFTLRSEGRITVHKDTSGWLARYQFTTPGGRVFYGARMLLLPDEPGTKLHVLDIELTSARSKYVVPNVFAAGTNGAMRMPFFRSTFGTEPPY